MELGGLVPFKKVARIWGPGALGPGAIQEILGNTGKSRTWGMEKRKKKEFIFYLFEIDEFIIVF